MEQYCESVPGPAGDRGVDADGKSVELSAKALKTREALRRSNVDSQELSKFLAATPAFAAPGAAPASAASTKTDAGRSSERGPDSSVAPKGSRSTAGGEATRQSEVAATEVPGGVASAVQASSSAGAGVLLGVGLLGASVAAAALVNRRRAH